MGEEALLGLWYQCNTSTQYRSQKRTRETTKAWSKATAPLTSPLPVANASESQKVFVGLLKSRFSEPDVVWSMPSDLLSRHAPDPTNVVEQLQLVLKEVAHTPDFRQHIFFKVVNARPEMKHRI